MTYIKPGSQGNTAINDAVLSLVDNTFLNPLKLTLQQRTIDGILCLVVNQPETKIVLGQVQYILPAASTVINTNVVTSPTTYFVYVKLVGTTPTIIASTANPEQTLLKEDYIVELVIRFSANTNVTIYYCKQPFQSGIFGTVHNVADETIFKVPQWVSGFDLLLNATGYISTTAGQYRYPSNDHIYQSEIQNGAFVLDNEQIGLNLPSITQYSDNSLISPDCWTKILVGAICDMGYSNSVSYLIVRQNKPTIEYTTCSQAVADADQCAATSFPISYREFVTPLYYLVMKAGTYSTSELVVIDIRSSGLSSSGGSSGRATSDHHQLQNLTTYDDHFQYIPVNGTRPLTSNWDAGSNSIKALNFISDIVTGTAPVAVSSTTVCPSLNADMVDGAHGSALIHADGTVGLIADWNAGLYRIEANTFKSDVATGTAPLSVASTTVVTNLNADLLDGHHASDFLTGTGYLKADGTVSLTADWDAGLYRIEASTFKSKAVTGIMPISVVSTTLCPNLNADLLDGLHSTGFVKADGTVKLIADWNAGLYRIEANTFKSDVATGTAPLSVASTTVVTNLNADLLDGHHASDFLTGTGYLKANGTVSLTADWDAGLYRIEASTFKSKAVTGIMPISVVSTTLCPNLNADLLDGLHSTGFVKADGTVKLTADWGSNAYNIGTSGTITMGHGVISPMSGSGQQNGLEIGTIVSTGSAFGEYISTVDISSGSGGEVAGSCINSVIGNSTSVTSGLKINKVAAGASTFGVHVGNVISTIGNAYGLKNNFVTGTSGAYGYYTNTVSTTKGHAFGNYIYKVDASTADGFAQGIAIDNIFGGSAGAMGVHIGDMTTGPYGSIVGIYVDGGTTVVGTLYGVRVDNLRNSNGPTYGVYGGNFKSSGSGAVYGTKIVNITSESGDVCGGCYDTVVTNSGIASGVKNSLVKVVSGEGAAFGYTVKSVVNAGSGIAFGIAVDQVVGNAKAEAIGLYIGSVTSGSSNFAIMAASGRVAFRGLISSAISTQMKINTDTGELSYSTSARALKKNIVYTVESDWLYNLKPCTYDRKDESMHNEIGLIAEDLVEAIPEDISCNMICKNSDGEIIAYDKDYLIVPMLRELQKLKDRVDTMEISQTDGVEV
jgi:hypothetical protein